MSRIILLVSLASAFGCESTYHPEYHPVTVTTVHQAWSGAPVTVTPVTNAPLGVVPLVVSGQAQPIVVQQPVLADPEVVFRR